jgi:hypothetical protein
LVRDTGSPPFVVDGNININRDSRPVKGCLLTVPFNGGPRRMSG